VNHKVARLAIGNRPSTRRKRFWNSANLTQGGLWRTVWTKGNKTGMKRVSRCPLIALGLWAGILTVAAQGTVTICRVHHDSLAWRHDATGSGGGGAYRPLPDEPPFPNVIELPFQGGGTITFGNKSTAAGINAPVKDWDGTPLAGAGFLAQLYAGPTEWSLAPVGSPVPFKVNGYIGNGVVAIPTVAPGANAFCQMRAWDATAPTWEAAYVGLKRNGYSNIICVKTGGLGEPPSTPGDMVGLMGFWMFGYAIPEPSTIPLGLLGCAGVLLWRCGSVGRKC
jgi:hypothetical protein